LPAHEERHCRMKERHCRMSFADASPPFHETSAHSSAVALDIRVRVRNDAQEAEPLTHSLLPQHLQHGADAVTAGCFAKLEIWGLALRVVCVHEATDIIRTVACLPKLFSKPTSTRACRHFGRVIRERTPRQARCWHVELEVGLLCSVKSVVRAMNKCSHKCEITGCGEFTARLQSTQEGSELRSCADFILLSRLARPALLVGAWVHFRHVRRTAGL